MKAKDILDNYCRLYRVTMPEINPAETQYFITISPDGAEVLYLRKASKLLGQIIGAAMKRGTVLHVRNGAVSPLTWENWKQTWNKLFAPKVRDRKPAPMPNYSRPYKSKMFEEGQQRSAHKKPQKHGFECTFVANKSMNLLTPARVPSIQIGG
ncbi:MULTISPECIES: hypothetical protein [Bacteroides]|jgi:hypothetical protein|uniref:hypothetical protein n=1 Tax=Bacteroides TaxID=816 RepID=UPI0006C688D1|nr:hypothetical protein [Bacteroides uniformis]CUN77772.1 Uncharacterised protein [Bacteroides uniformis]